MLKEILNEVKNKDVIFTRMCDILRNCSLHESNHKVCGGWIDEIKWKFHSKNSNNHLVDLFELSGIDIFKGDWVAFEDEDFYSNYKKIAREPYKLSDEDFMISYCYSISGLVRSWLNFYDNPDYTEDVDGSPIGAYNSNVETFSSLLKHLRGIIVTETKGCDYINIEVKDPTFELIMNGLKLKRIV